MEVSDSFEQAEPENISRSRRLVSNFIAGLRFIRDQLVVADLSPHEGRLRSSIMPSKYIDVPDYPPADDSKI